MKYKDLRNKYQLSTTAIKKLLFLKIIVKGEDGEYQTPWREVQLFKPADVAAFLSKHSGEYWNIDRLMSIHRGLFFDVHKGMSERSLYRITFQDFRSLAGGEGCETVWDREFKSFKE